MISAIYLAKVLAFRMQSATGMQPLTLALFTVLAAQLGLGCTVDTSRSNDDLKDPSGGPSGKGDDWRPESAGSVIQFDRSFGDAAVSGPLYRGGSVRVEYARDRMYDVVNGSGGSIGYFASNFHCYGYGCCDVEFPTVTAHYRFSDAGAWQSAVLDSDDAADLSIPVNAENLELWFDTTGFDIKTWYCGCDQACAEANRLAAGTSHRDYQAWDSRYGKNFQFAVDDFTSIPSVRFDRGTNPQVTEGLRAGAQVELVYDRDRFYDVVNWSTGSGRFFASQYHCYGYGCCEVEFDTIGVHYRFRDGDDWIDAALPTTNGLVLAVPADASRLEVWFDVPGYEIRTWYCGCDAACAQNGYDNATPRYESRAAWDSNYAQNFVFAVAP